MLNLQKKNYFLLNIILLFLKIWEFLLNVTIKDVNKHFIQNVQEEIIISSCNLMKNLYYLAKNIRKK